jgi:hypothetical protein
MAIIKLGCSKSANNSISYAEKKADIKGGINCDADIAKIQFKATKNIFNKNGGIECHTIIQSFLPNEVDINIANEIGCQLAEKIAIGFEAAVYTHSDKDHIHNHIIINSVNFETGIKYQSNRKKLFEIRDLSDELCLKYCLSIANNKKPQEINYTLTEREILQKGQSSWKDEIRQVIDELKDIAKNYDDFKLKAQKNYGIIIDDSRRHIVYYHPDYKESNIKDNKKKARGKTLGADYTKEVIQNVFKNKIRDDIGAECTKIREFPSKNGIDRIKRRDATIDGTINSISKSVKSITRRGREEAETERARDAEQNRRNEQKQQRNIEKDKREYRGLGL